MAAHIERKRILQPISLSTRKLSVVETNVETPTTQFLDNSKKFALSNSMAIEEICSPIFSVIGAHGFAFQRIYSNGRRLFLSTSAEWIEYIYQRNSFLTSGFKKYSQLQPFTLWQHWPKQDVTIQPFLADTKERFNFHNGLVVVQKYENYIDNFTFRGYQDGEVNNTYLNELPVIEKFLSYFLVKADPIICESEENALVVPENKIILIPGYNTNENEKNTQIYDLLKEKRIYYQVNGRGMFLTERETECVCLLIKGQTMKQIGSSLNISSRTVEDYIGNIKIKLSCYLKSDIIKKVMSYRWNHGIIVGILHTS